MACVLKLVFFLVILHLAFASTIYSMDGDTLEEDPGGLYSSSASEDGVTSEEDLAGLYPSDDDSHSGAFDPANKFDTTPVTTWKVLPGTVVPDTAYPVDFTTVTLAALAPPSVWHMGSVSWYTMIVYCQGPGCKDLDKAERIRNGVTIVGSNDETDKFIFTENTFSEFALPGVDEITITYELI